MPATFPLVFGFAPLTKYSSAFQFDFIQSFSSRYLSAASLLIQILCITPLSATITPTVILGILFSLVHPLLTGPNLRLCLADLGSDGATYRIFRKQIMLCEYRLAYSPCN